MRRQRSRALLRGLGKMLLRPPRDHRRDFGHAQLGGLLDRPLHAVEFINGEHQRYGERRIGRQFGHQVQPHLAAVLGQRDRGDLGMKNAPARDHVGLHARLCAQYTRHVLGLRALDGGGGFIPMFGNPAAAGHAISPGTVFPLSLFLPL